MKWIKRLSISILCLFTLLLALIFALPWLIDPNDLKPQLQKLASEQGYELQLQGPISWTFYPSLGLSLEDVIVQRPSAASEGSFSSTDLLHVHQARVAVAAKPLLSRQVLIQTIAVDGADIHVKIDVNGNLNWQTARGSHTQENLQPQNSADNSTAPASSDDSIPSQNLVIAADSLSLNNVNLHFLNQQTQQQINAEALTLNIEQFAFDSSAFPIELTLRLQHSDLPNPVQLSLTTELELPNFQADNLIFAVNNGQLTTEFISNGAGTNTRLETSFHFTGQRPDKGSNSINIEGRFALAPINLTQLLQTLEQPLPNFESSTASRSFDLSTDFNLKMEEDRQLLSLEKLLLHFDDSTLNGKVDLTVPSSTSENLLPNINFQAQIDRFNVDHYLTKAQEKTTQPTVAENTSASNTENLSESSDETLPLEILRTFDATINLHIDALTANKAGLTQTQFTANGKQGLWKILELSTRLYEGGLNATATIDARSNSLLSDFHAQLKNIDAQKALSEQADFGDLSGIINGQLDGTTSAATINQLLPSTTATFLFSSDTLVLQGYNAEQQYCEVVTQLQKSTPLDKSWPSTTTVNNVSGQFHLNNKHLLLENFSATFGAIELNANGDFNLDNQRFTVRLPMTFETASRLSDSTSDTVDNPSLSSNNGCAIESKFLINRELDVLHCNGTLETIEFGKQCGIDRDALRGVLKEAVRYNAKKEIKARGVDKKVDEKKQEVRDKLKDKLKEALGGDEEADSTRELLRNIFGRD